MPDSVWRIILYVVGNVLDRRSCASASNCCVSVEEVRVRRGSQADRSGAQAAEVYVPCLTQQQGKAMDRLFYSHLDLLPNHHSATRQISCTSSRLSCFMHNASTTVYALFSLLVAYPTASMCAGGSQKRSDSLLCCTTSDNRCSGEPRVSESQVMPLRLIPDITR